MCFISVNSCTGISVSSFTCRDPARKNKLFYVFKPRENSGVSSRDSITLWEGFVMIWHYHSAWYVLPISSSRVV